MKKNKHIKSGAATVIFMMVIALVLMILLTATQSRLLLSLRRGLSVADSLTVGYASESEVNDIMARLAGGYLESAEIPEFTKTVGDTKYVISGEDNGDTQIVTITASRGYATSKVRGIRRVQNVEEVNNVEMILALDCTGSMNTSDCPGCPSRFGALRSAAVNFIENVAALPDADKFKIGISLYGTTAVWLQSGGLDITPQSGHSLSQIRDAIQTGIKDTRGASGSQCLRVNDYTNVGLGYRFSHDFLRTSKKEGVKQVEIVITDGLPNRREENPNCFAKDPLPENYLRCTLADDNTFVGEIGHDGIRDPQVDAYGVTIYNNPDPTIAKIFETYATKDGYFNATRANQLKDILEKVLGRILEDRSTVTIERVIPDPL